MRGMNAVVILLPRQHNVVTVQPVEGAFAVTLITPDGWRYHLGTREGLGEARSLAHAEAFKAGRCRVQLVGTEVLS